MHYIKFFTLGCKVNQYESDALANLFEAMDYCVTDNEQEADVFIVNSCTVTAESDRKTRQLLRRLHKSYPNAVIALTGCYPQAYPDVADDMPFINIITGERDRKFLLKAIPQYLADGERIVNIVPHKRGEEFEHLYTHNFGKKTRAFLKIQDGCENYCTYCIIPTSRGPVRFMDINTLKKELEAIADAGYKEVVLTGIHLASYGQGTDYSLIDAIDLACATPGIERVRLGSLEPDKITPDMIERMSRQPKMCPQFHLSLQSGCDKILKKMNRHYDSAEYLSITDKIKECFTAPALTTDIMVGFPDETEEDFADTLSFARKVGFSRIHVFAYSRRPGTYADRMPNQITGAVKKERSHRLIEVEAELRHKFMESLIGSTQQVLIEEQGTDGWHGYTKNYVPVTLMETGDLHNKLVDVIITGHDEEYCTAVLKDTLNLDIKL